MSLPKSVRHSYDSKRLSFCLPADAEDSSNRHSPSAAAKPSSAGRDESLRQSPGSTSDSSFGLVLSEPRKDKGKGRAISDDGMAALPTDGDAGDAVRSYSKDLERGPDILGDVHHDSANRNSTASMPDGIGIGSAISSSNSSIMGDPEAQPDMAEEWGPQHPCFPHRNPHVSVDDPDYITTRIIRIRRDWLILGDLAPTFSNLYPEILDPAGMAEQEFRRVIDKLNRELTAAFSPWGVRNVLDGVMGLLTGWLWEDVGLTAAKSRLARLERWIEQWNENMARSADENGPIPPKIIPLRQTGYMTVCSPPTLRSLLPLLTAHLTFTA